MSRIQKILRNDTVLGCIGCMIILLLCMPYIVLGENSYITIHDNLDGIIANLKLLKDNHTLYNPNAILPMMGGIKRSSFGNEWNLTLLPFAFLPCYWANVVNIVLVKLTAFIGMFLLLRKFAATDLHPVVSMVISVAFACIPYYATCCGISAAGVPLVLYAFLNLRDKTRLIISYIIVIYYALYSFLPFSGLFVCAYIFIYGIYLYLKEHTLNWYYCGAFIMLCGIYILTNISLLAPFFIHSEYISHRTEYNVGALIPFYDNICDWWQWVWHSQCHSGFFPVAPIIIVFAISLLFRRTKKMWNIGALWLSLVLLVLAMKSLPYILPEIQMTQEMQFDRFYFLYPCVCIAMLAISVENIMQLVGNQRIIGSALIGVCILFVAKVTMGDPEIRKNWKLILTSGTMKEPTYKQFYAEDLFDVISADLDMSHRQSAKIVSIAMFPAIGEYNGFYCIDGYMSDYALAYKQIFRSSITEELEKNQDLKNYFDYWGNRCYLFSSELFPNFIYPKDDTTAISRLDINWQVLHALGCEYVISALSLPAAQALDYVGVYENEQSYWRLYVYRMTEPQ